MGTKKNFPKYSPEVLDRAVRMMCAHQKDQASQRAKIESFSGNIGCTA